jgi:hypothetical protein
VACEDPLPQAASPATRMSAIALETADRRRIAASRDADAKGFVI